MERARIGVTGSTGGLGGRDATRLADHGVAQRLLIRDEARAPRLEHAETATFGGYDDTEGLHRALDGIETVLFVSAAEAARRSRHPDARALHRVPILDDRFHDAAGRRTSAAPTAAAGRT